MELGLAIAPERAWIPIYEELGLKRFGCGVDPSRENIQNIEWWREKGYNFVAKMGFDKALWQDPRCMDKMVDTLTMAAQLLPVEWFEIWPEPGCPHITRGALSLEKQRFVVPGFVDIMKVAYETIKAVNPSINVINGGIGQHGQSWTIQEFLEHGIDYTDYLCLHPYIFEPMAPQVIDKISSLIADAMDYMERMGKPKDVIITEWGYPSAEDGVLFASYVDHRGIRPAKESGQAEIVGAMLDMFEGLGCPMFLFDYLIDTNAMTWGAHIGLIRENGMRKPSFEVVKQWAAQRRG